MNLSHFLFVRLSIIVVISVVMWLGIAHIVTTLVERVIQ